MTHATPSVKSSLSSTSSSSSPVILKNPPILHPPLSTAFEFQNMTSIIENLTPVYSQKDPLFTSRTKLDSFYFIYCILHFFITILIDSVLVVPKEYMTSFQLDIIAFHITKNNDFLLSNPPNWLVFFGWLEIIFQLPFFLFGAIALYKRKSKVYPFLFIYGVEAAGTTLVCLIYIALQGEANGLTSGEVKNLIGVYLPTFLIPAFLSFDMLFNRIWYDSPIIEKEQIKKAD